MVNRNRNRSSAPRNHGWTMVRALAVVAAAAFVVGVWIVVVKRTGRLRENTTEERSHPPPEARASEPAVNNTQGPPAPAAPGPVVVKSLELRRFNFKKNALTPPKPVRLEGHVVLVNLWGSACRPCLEELPLLAVLARGFASRQKFKYISLSNDALLAKVKPHLWAVGTKHLYYFTESVREKLTGKNDSLTLPVTLVFDAQGRLKEKVERSLMFDGEGKRDLGRLRGIADALESALAASDKLPPVAGSVHRSRTCIPAADYDFCTWMEVSKRSP